MRGIKITRVYTKGGLFVVMIPLNANKEKFNIIS